MPKKIIMFILICMLFPAVIFANPNPKAIPCFPDLTWGEESNSVLQKYRLTKMPSYNGEQGLAVYKIQLDTPYIYDIRVLPTGYASFVDNKLYSISITFSLYGNETDYARFKAKLINEFGEPDKIDTSMAHYEVASWNKEIFSVVLTKSDLRFSNNELAKQLESK